MYRAAGRDTAQVPWHHVGAHPLLTDWLEQPVATPPGRRALVTGCGLGDDAAALAVAGYEVTGVDIAPSAIAWARRRHRRTDVDWQVADLLAPGDTGDDSSPGEVAGDADLVVEIGTVRMLPGVVRDAMMDAVARRVAPGGVLVVVTTLAKDAESARHAAGPPWPQAPSELAVYRGPGLVRLALEHGDPDPDGTVQVRATYQRPAGTPPGAAGAAGEGLPIVPS
ncbi:MAG: methyltransferase domain-containing protein [Nitriliruptoraceae bacterium]|nr:methyltransferase domain-containing protein [Nitriliruptoraceae bacterium]